MASGDAEASEVMINRINIYITYFLIALFLIELIYIKTLMIITECKYLRDGVGRRRCGGERPGDTLPVSQPCLRLRKTPLFLSFPYVCPEPVLVK